MSKYLPRIVNTWGRWLLLHRPDLYIMRVHIVAPGAMLALGSAWLFATGLNVEKTPIPDPSTYWVFLLMASCSTSMYWIYLVRRQQSILRFRQGMAGWTGHMTGLACLAALNAVPFVFSLTLHSRIVEAHESRMTSEMSGYLHQNSTAVTKPIDYSKWTRLDASVKEAYPNSHDRQIIERLFRRAPVPNLMPAVPTVATLIIEAVTVVALIHSLGPASVAVTLAAIAGIVGLTAMIVSSLQGDGGRAASSICLSLMAVGLAALIRQVFQSKGSRIAAASLVACATGVPLFFVFRAMVLNTTDSFEGVLIAGVCLSLVASPLFQFSLNRSRSAPH
jgi:hypothetical protein